MLSVQAVSAGQALAGVTLTREEEMKSSAELTPAMQSELDAINELLQKTEDELESSGRFHWRQVWPGHRFLKEDHQ